MTVLTRCRAAFPCSEPIGLQYHPDPLIAGPWAQGAPSSAVSAHVVLKQNPKIELDQREPAEPPPDDPVVSSVRFFLKKHPGLKKPTAKPEAEATPSTAAEPAAVEPKP
jgi:hypothetical protein